MLLSIINSLFSYHMGNQNLCILMYTSSIKEKSNVLLSKNNCTEHVSDYCLHITITYFLTCHDRRSVFSLFSLFVSSSLVLLVLCMLRMCGRKTTVRKSRTKIDYFMHSPAFSSPSIIHPTRAFFFLDFLSLVFTKRKKPK